MFQPYLFAKLLNVLPTPYRSNSWIILLYFFNLIHERDRQYNYHKLSVSKGLVPWFVLSWYVVVTNLPYVEWKELWLTNVVPIIWSKMNLCLKSLIMPQGTPTEAMIRPAVLISFMLFLLIHSAHLRTRTPPSCSFNACLLSMLGRR